LSRRQYDIITTASTKTTTNHVSGEAHAHPPRQGRTSYHAPSADGSVTRYAIFSDGLFDLKSLPRKAVIGAGYIADELAGVLAALGSDTLVVVL